jgi:hypothetical protein
MDYRKKLGLSINDKDKTERFYAQMYNFFADASSVKFSTDRELAFCNMLGVAINQPDDIMIFDLDEPRGLGRAWIYLRKYKGTFTEFLFGCVTLINAYPNSQKEIKKGLQMVICNALDDCLLAYDIFEDKDGVFIFPKGAEELDEALVSQPLFWLCDYPKTRTAFIKALKEYADAADENASDIADKFRKTLETFFREFFTGDKSLENYKSIYGSYLKEHGIPKEISNDFERLLQSYTTFMNGYAKHRDATSDKVLEYIMYQTGNIMRLLITLKQEENTHAD